MIYTLKLNSLKFAQGSGKEVGNLSTTRAEAVCPSAPRLTWKSEPLVLQRGRQFLQARGRPTDYLAWPGTDKELCCKTRADLFLFGASHLSTGAVVRTSSAFPIVFCDA